MIATDIDGTIAGWDSKFSFGVRNCISNLTTQGIKIVLVTGRMHSSAVHVAKDLGLTTPIISYQGGLVKTIDGITLYQKNLNQKYAREIIAWARSNRIHINLYIDDKLYVENDNDIIKNYVSGKYIDYEVCNFDNLKLENVNKILAIDFKDASLVTSWVEELKSKFPNLYIVKSTPYFCEIGSSEAKKSNGVEFLAKLWGIKKEEIMTIGDQNNDIDLIQSGGVGVAMGNGTEELKRYADLITDTVENDGFVKAVEQIIYGKV